MATPYPYLILNRLCIFKSGQPVYDEKYHHGLNIIHGENGSGKSTIADAIFYILGGDGVKWKPEASSCEFVIAEISASGTAITLKREISDKAPMIQVFNGTFEKASETGFVGWNAYQPNRSKIAKGEITFSQIMFKALDLPETASGDSSNLTMHQLLRVLYSDQMLSPVQKIFRYERFDEADTRVSVSDLLLGVGGTDLYEMTLEKRELEKQFQKIDHELKSLLNIVQLKNISLTSEKINEALTENAQKIIELNKVIESHQSDEVYIKAMQKEQEQKLQKLQAQLTATREEFGHVDQKIQEAKFEVEDDEKFIEYLEQSLIYIAESETTHTSIGDLTFEYCPSCLSPLDKTDDANCSLCKKTHDGKNISNRLLDIKIDFATQLRETQFLVRERLTEIEVLIARQQDLQKIHKNLRAEYDAFVASHMASQDSKFRELSEKVGYLKAESENLKTYLKIGIEIDKLSTEKADLNQKLSKLTDKIDAMEISRKSRRHKALHEISTKCVELLKKDLPRQDQFAQATNVDVNFKEDVLMVDGATSFSASGIVLLKNSFHLSLVLAAIEDPKFRLPRFSLLDTTEDKGMEAERSQNFQDNVEQYLSNIALPHQFILTTSKISPKLADSSYIVGRKYTRSDRTLQFAKKSSN